MINKLENLFHSALTTTFDSSDSSKFWFKTDDQLIFGLDKSAISDVELNLINSLFTKIETEAYEKTSSRQHDKWYQFLFKDGKEIPSPLTNKEIQFFYFYLKKPLDELNDFKEAIAGHFNAPIILMISHTHGIIIEENPTIDFNQQTFDELNATLTSDFLVKIYTYIGQLHTMNSSIKEKFHHEYEFFKTAHRFAGIDKSRTFHEAFPLVFMQSPNAIHKNLFSESLLQALSQKDTLHTIELFLKSNLNVSLAAKNLYIHRNSLQYRLDKFFENTGIEIRSFANATFISLVILFLNIEMD